VQLAQDEQVVLLSEDTEYAFVQNAEGKRCYVARGLLKHRNMAKRPADKSDTHSVVRATPAFLDRPPLPPEPLPSRSLGKIDQEQLTLNALFLSEKTHREVIAPRNVARFLVDEVTGERCWHAYECTHPNCPGPRTAGREYFVFIHTEHDSQEAIHCPACLTVRNLTAESVEQRNQWGAYVNPYELPETVRRRKELDLERRRTIDALQRGATR